LFKIKKSSVCNNNCLRGQEKEVKDRKLKVEINTVSTFQDKKILEEEDKLSNFCPESWGWGWAS
jgi:hypothetical protein